MDNENLKEKIIPEFSKIVFKIITKDGSGSGLYHSDYNAIITNFHVIQGYRVVGVEDANKNSFSADVILINPALDIAILKPRKKIQTEYRYDFLESSQAKVGKKVKVLGYPFGMPFTVTEGIISSQNQIISERSFIQTDAAVNPGNSGGPMIDEEGRVIGITTLKFIQAENIAFAIPSEYIQQDLEDFRNNSNDKFSVKCFSCFSILFQPTEFCPNCGIELKNLGEYFQEKKKIELEIFFEEILNYFNIDPIAAQKGKELWEFYYGSSLIRFFRYKSNFYFATSPLVKLPKKNIAKFYQFILTNPYPPFFLGVYNNKLYLSYRIHVEDFKERNYNTIKNNLKNFISLVDIIDNHFMENYQCEFSEESKKANTYTN